MNRHILFIEAFEETNNLIIVTITFDSRKKVSRTCNSTCKNKDKAKSIEFMPHFLEGGEEPSNRKDAFLKYVWSEISLLAYRICEICLPDGSLSSFQIY